MTECPQCHAQAEPEDKYCGQCGCDLNADPTLISSRTQHALDATEIKYRLGLVFFKKDNIEGAVKLWEEILAAHPEHEGARDMLEKIRRETGE